MGHFGQHYRDLMCLLKNDKYANKLQKIVLKNRGKNNLANKT